MTITTENKLLSDLGELGGALRGDTQDGNREATQDPDMLKALVVVAKRCEGARTELIAARSMYDADQTQNKVVALRFAEAFTVSIEERRWLHEALTSRLLKGRGWKDLSKSERAARKGWMQSVFPLTHSDQTRATQKDAVDALAQTLTRVSDKDSLATPDEWTAFGKAVAHLQAAFADLARENLDDKPISDTLKAAFVNASDQRVGARSILQGILASEGHALSLADFLKRRRKPAAAATDPSPTPQQP